MPFLFRSAAWNIARLAASPFLTAKKFAACAMAIPAMEETGTISSGWISRKRNAMRRIRNTEGNAKGPDAQVGAKARSMASAL